MTWNGCGGFPAAGLEIHTVARGDEKGRIARRGARFADQRIDALQVFLGLGGLGGPPMHRIVGRVHIYQPEVRPGLQEIHGHLPQPVVDLPAIDPQRLPVAYDEIGRRVFGGRGEADVLIE